MRRKGGTLRPHGLFSWRRGACRARLFRERCSGRRKGNCGMQTGAERVRYRRSGHVVRREIADEVLLVPVHGGVADLQRVFALNDVGGFLWDCLSEPATPDELVAAVTAAFEVEPAVAHGDCAAFLDALRQRRLVESVPFATES
jgi:hypothetical protein